jgi:hypothetical protein
MFDELKQTFGGHGPAPEAFFSDLLDWQKTAADEIFAANEEPDDVFGIIKPVLHPDGPWESLMQRKAALLYMGMIHAGYESDWRYQEGVDTTNAASMAHLTGQESGMFQESFDSTFLGHFAMRPFAIANGIDDPADFIARMKSDHRLAFEYYFRSSRISFKWAGPLLNPGMVRAHLFPARLVCWVRAITPAP